jgi:hypothetical protein
MKDIKIQEGIDSIDRVKLLMKYSMGKTLTENLEQLQGNLLKEDAMGAERMINAHNREVLGADWDKSPPDEFANGKTKTTIDANKLGGKIEVIEGTVSNQFQPTDNSGNLFPGLINDPKKGWYQLVGIKRVYYPLDSYWSKYSADGFLKSFKTGRSVSSDSEDYHFLMQLEEKYSDFATSAPGTPQDREDRGWIMLPSFYTTKGSEEVPYDPSKIDIRSTGDKFFDDHSFLIQVGGAIILGVLTAGIADIIAASLIAAEAAASTIAATELAVELTGALTAANKAKLIGLGLDFVVQGSFNGLIGLYESSRGQDPTISYVFALLPLVHNIGFVRAWLGNSIKFTEAEVKEIVSVVSKFDPANPQTIRMMSKPAQNLYKNVIEAAEKNPEGLKNLVKENAKYEAALAAKNPALAKTNLQLVKDWGIKLPSKAVHMAKQVGLDFTVMGATVVVKEWPLIIQHLKNAYHTKFGEDMPDSKVDEIVTTAKKNLPDEQARLYVEQIAIDYETQKEQFTKIINAGQGDLDKINQVKNNFTRELDSIKLTDDDFIQTKPSSTETQSVTPKDSIPAKINGVSPFGGGGN